MAKYRQKIIDAVRGKGHLSLMFQGHLGKSSLEVSPEFRDDFDDHFKEVAETFLRLLLYYHVRQQEDVATSPKPFENYVAELYLGKDPAEGRIKIAKEGV